MQKHPRKSSGRHTPQRVNPRPQVTSPQADVYGFFAALFALIAPGRFERLVEYRNSKRGRPPELPLPDLLAALLFHFLCGAGTASEHVFQLLGRRLCDSAIAERRSVLPWALWEHWLREALRSTAHRRRHPEAFYRGWRLVAIDGTQYSVSNSMLYSQTLEKLRALRLEGMADALDEQRRQTNITQLDFDDRLALLVERQWLWKENRGLATRLKKARFKINATLEDLDYPASRGLKRAQIDQLRASQWVKHQRNCLNRCPLSSESAGCAGGW